MRWQGWTACAGALLVLILCNLLEPVAARSLAEAVPVLARRPAVAAAEVREARAAAAARVRAAGAAVSDARLHISTHVVLMCMSAP